MSFREIPVDALCDGEEKPSVGVEFAGTSITSGRKGRAERGSNQYAVE
jgi:hypothetical protein